MNTRTDGSTENGPQPWLVLVLSLLPLLIGCWFGLVDRGDVHLFGDEFHSLWTLHQPFDELITHYDRNGSGVALPLLQKLASDLFGPGLFAYRFPALLGALASLLIVFAATRRLVGPVPALIASLALAASSLHIFYSRFGRSYSLAVFLGLAMAYALARALQNRGAGHLWFVPAGLCAGLLPVAHLASASFGLALAGIALLVLLLQGHVKKLWFGWLFGIVLGAAVCYLAHQPAWEELMKFIDRKKSQSSGISIAFIDVAALIAGGRTAAWIWVCGLPLASLWMLYRKKSAALLLITAAWAPVIALAITQPYGGVYAYTRYLIVALPFMLMLLAWGLDELCRCLAGKSGAANYLCLGVGLILVGVSFFSGPQGVQHTDDGPFANTYLAMMPLPAFDQPFDRTPAFYEDLSKMQEQVKVIEAPELLSKAVLLYRNYYLQHGKPVEIGTLSLIPNTMPSGPYRSLFPMQKLLQTDARYLIVHKAIDREVAEYWRFVFEKTWPGMKAAGQEAFMDTHSTLPPDLDRHIGQLGRMARNWIAQAKDTLGDPVYDDSFITVWKL